MSELFHYLPEENIIPGGFDATDLDWTLISWDMVLDNADGEREFAQFILGPGVLLVRCGFENVNTWLFSVFDFKKIVTRQHPDQNMLTVSQRMIDEYSHLGYHMVSSPYVFTVDPDNYSLHISHNPYPPTVAESIGEVLACTYEQESKTSAVTDVINASCAARQRHFLASLGVELKEDVS